jgi:SPP1 gp7 family putative phage head morphogenesis protein
VTLILLEAARPEIALQAEMRRVWAKMDRMDDESARRVLDGVSEMRKDILDRLTALPTTTIEGQETYQATALRTLAADLDEIGGRFAQRYSRELGEDMRGMARYSDETHRAALAQLARSMDVPPALISLAPLGLSDVQIEAAILLNQSAIKNVSQAVVQAVNREIQMVVFGGQSRWDAIKNIRAALGTTGKDIGALTKRAMLIERTAMIQAFSTAADHAYKQASEELSGLRVEWVTVQDRRVDPKCVALSGATKEPGGTFPGGVSAPPLHPACRCRLVGQLPGWGSLKMKTRGST